jgi:hypothetical protein
MGCYIPSPLNRNIVLGVLLHLNNTFHAFHLSTTSTMYPFSSQSGLFTDPWHSNTCLQQISNNMHIKTNSMHKYPLLFIIQEEIYISTQYLSVQFMDLHPYGCHIYSTHCFSFDIFTVIMTLIKQITRVIEVSSSLWSLTFQAQASPSLLHSPSGDPSFLPRLSRTGRVQRLHRVLQSRHPSGPLLRHL